MSKLIQWYSRQKIKNKLLFSLGCFSFGSLVLSAIIYSGLWHVMVNNEIQNVSGQILSALEANLETNLEMLSSYSKIIIGDADIQEFLSNGYDYNQRAKQQTINNNLCDYIGIDSMISSIYIFADNGTVISQDTIRNKTPKHLLEDMPWYDEVRKRNGYWYVELETENTFEMKNDNPCISFIRLIRNLTTFEPIGVLVINVTQDYLMKAFSHMGSSDYDVMMFSSKGKFVFGSLSEEDSLTRLAADTVKKENSGFFSADRKQYYAQQLVNDRNEWKLVILSETTATRSAFYRQAFILSIAILMIICIMIVAEAGMLNHVLTFPIHMLAMQMKKAEEGNFSEMPEYPKRDEIGILFNGYNAMVRRIRELFVNLEREQKEMYKARLDILQAQIKPHFLYNSLGTAQALLKNGKAENAERMVHALSEYYKRSLSGGQDEITIRDDLEIARNYIEVQMIRFQEQCDVEYDIDDDLLDIRIPKLTLQPLIENCFVHGVIPSNYFCTIRVRIFGDEENTYIDISDDGVGMPESKVESIMKIIKQHDAKSGQNGGIGIINTVTRLQMYFGIKDIFQMESGLQAGTRYCIRIPNLCG